MVPAKLRAKVVLEKLSWVERMMAGIRSLPLASLDTFMDSPYIPAAAESYLRRGLEALLDLGPHGAFLSRDHAGGALRDMHHPAGRCRAGGRGVQALDSGPSRSDG
jgi:hypothetical protein